MNAEVANSYPYGLLDWAGHRVGGVKRLFHSTSGRPTGSVIATPLLDRLTDWARALAKGVPEVPRVILLVGGPGNGKTESVEHSISALDIAFGAQGSLISFASEKFDSSRADVQRLVMLPLGSAATGAVREIAVVQDASGGLGVTSSPPAELVDDLEKYVVGDPLGAYIACVNRGVLDDALIYASENKRLDAAELIEQIIKSVGIAPDAPACWPLKGYPVVGVWPMDVESLVDASDEGDTSCAGVQLIELATDFARWPKQDACAAGSRCPFCISRQKLSQEQFRTSFLEILRWYELATGKRWTFRDLFSLTSYLLAGVPRSEKGSADPCQWAADVLALASRPAGKPESLRLAATFLLAATQYQHALFPDWPRDRIRAMRRDIAELQLESNAGLMGFYHFIAMNRGLSLPATLEPQLRDLCAVLDPALADPDLEVAVSSQTTIKFRDLDVRFSRSVSEGFQFIKKFHCLSLLETDVLQKLVEADDRLAEHDVVNKRPAIAARLQLLLRDFACRFVRRSIGVRSGVVRDKKTLEDFQLVVDGDPTLVHAAAKQVEGLLNDRERFLVALNTTFGESLPPEQRRAILATEKQKIKPWPVVGSDRPNPSLRFLSFGSGESIQSIPLTFELFKSVRELRLGVLPASLPRGVVALLDTTRAKLAGKIVRDESLLDGAEIRISSSAEIVARELRSFVVRLRDSKYDL